MKRQKRFKKIRLPPFVENLKEVIIRKLYWTLAIFVFFAILLFLTKTFLYNSDYFRLRSIEIKDAFVEQSIASSASAEVLKNYKGRNIFTINLKAVTRSLQALYPDSKEMLVKIDLPDRLVVKLKFRKPIALVRNIKYYPIDEEGVVLPGVDVNLFQKLPVISGVDIAREYKRGKRSMSRNLSLAIELLKELRKSKYLAGYAIATIDASDARNLSFNMKNGMEIKIGCEDFSDRLEVLGKTLKDPRIAIDRIKYIDLRFQDVVISPK